MSGHTLSSASGGRFALPLNGAYNSTSNSKSNNASSKKGSSGSSSTDIPEYTDVVIVGAGPTGLTLAITLALQGVSFVIVDANAIPHQESRALAVHARTLEILEDLGVASSFLLLGLRCRSVQLWVNGHLSLSVPLRDAETEATVRLPPLKALAAAVAGTISGGAAAAAAPEPTSACSSGTPFPFALMVPQSTTSQILERKLNELGHKVHRPVAVWRVQGFDAADPACFPPEAQGGGRGHQGPPSRESSGSSFRSPQEAADDGDEQQRLQQQQHRQTWPGAAAITGASTDSSNNPTNILGHPVSVHYGRYLAEPVVPAAAGEAAAAGAPAAPAEPPVRFGVINCRYVIGCDGARSSVRKSAAIAFEGHSNPRSFIVADVQLTPTLASGSSTLVSSTPASPPSATAPEASTTPVSTSGSSAAEQLHQQQREVDACQLLGCGGSEGESLWGEGLFAAVGRRVAAVAAAALEPGETERAKLMAMGRRAAAGDALEIHLTPKGFAACIPLQPPASEEEIAAAAAVGSGSSSKKNSSKLQQQLLLQRTLTRPADLASFRWRVVIEKNGDVADAAPAAAAVAATPAFKEAAAAAAAATAAAVAEEEGENDPLPLKRQETQDSRAELLQQVERVFVGCRVGEVYWSSTYRTGARIASAMRRGRILLAGDAAHVHPPVLGQGMNLGMQNAYNLGWKLARVLCHRASPQLLDSYAEESNCSARQVVGLTDRLFGIVLSASNAGGLLPRFLFRVAAPLAFHLPGVAQSCGQTLLMTHLTYKQPSSTLGSTDRSFMRGLKPGCRAPDCLVKVARVSRFGASEMPDPVAGYLFELLGKGRHLLLLHVMLLPPGARKQNMFGCEIAGAPLVSRYNSETVSALARLCQLAVLAASKSPVAAAAAASLTGGMGGAFSDAAPAEAPPLATTATFSAPFTAADFADSPSGVLSSRMDSGTLNQTETETETDNDNSNNDDSNNNHSSDNEDDENSSTVRPACSQGPARPAAAGAAGAEAGRVLRRHTEYSGGAAAAWRQLWSSDLRVVWCLHGQTAAVHTTATATSITSEIVRGPSHFAAPFRSRSSFMTQQQQQKQQQQQQHHHQPPTAARSGRWETEECHLLQRPVLQLLPPALLQQLQQASSSSSKGGGFILLDFLNDLQSKFGLTLKDPHASDGAEASGGFSLIRPDGYLAHAGRAGDSNATRGLLDYLLRF